MAEPNLTLRKIRTLSINLSDTLEFIRQHFKPLIGSFFALSGVFILLQIVLEGVVEGKLGPVKAGLQRFNAMGDFVRYISPVVALFGLVAWLTYIAMQTTVGAYMKYCDTHGGDRPALDDVWRIFIRYYPRLLLYSIPLAVTVAIGMLFCLLPGIFLAFLWVPFPFVVIMEDANLGEGISRCYALIRRDFWTTMGVYAITLLIYFAASVMLGLTGGMIAGLWSLVTRADVSFLQRLMAAVAKLASMLFYLLFLVSAALHYFSFVEQEDATGIFRRVEHMGHSASEDDPSEEL